jgi:hypothetical protein
VGILPSKQGDKIPCRHCCRQVFECVATLLDDVNFDDKQLKHGEYHGEMDGNADEIQTDVARGATKNGEGQYKLPDGTDVNFINPIQMDNPCR